MQKNFEIETKDPREIAAIAESRLPLDETYLCMVKAVDIDELHQIIDEIVAMGHRYSVELENHSKLGTQVNFDSLNLCIWAPPFKLSKEDLDDLGDYICGH